MNILKDINDQRAKGDSNGQITKLKKKVSTLTQQVNNLQSKIPPQTRISVKKVGDKDELVITEDIQRDRRVFSNENVVAVGEGIRNLYPVILPLMQIAQAAARGHDVINRRQEAHTVDGQGRPTKELMKDEDGKQVYLPNLRDKVFAIGEILMEDPDCRNALETLGKKLADAQTQARIKDKGHEVAQISLTPRSKPNPKGMTQGR